MTLDAWYDKYDGAAKKQGWSLYCAGGEITIMRIDLNEGNVQLNSDNEAMEIVFRNALAGDKMSILALFLDGKDTDEESYSGASDCPKQAEYEVYI